MVLLSIIELFMVLMLRTAFVAVTTFNVLERRIRSLLVSMLMAVVLGLPKPPPEPVVVIRFSWMVVPLRALAREMPVAPILVVLMMLRRMVALPVVLNKIPYASLAVVLMLLSSIIASKTSLR